MSDGALEAVVERFSTILREEGVHAALAFLNGRTRHRFTAVYRFDPPMLRTLGLFDRENPTLRLGGDKPMRETYCSLVWESAAPFATDDSGRDTRLVDHPARESVIAYCGVPIFADDGSCFGSLCHFDLRPRLAPITELPLLERAAPLVLRAVTHAELPA